MPMVLTSRTVEIKKRRKLWLSTFWKRKKFCFWWFWRGELLCTSSWNRFACSVAASSQLWAYFDLITGNLPWRPWSRLVRGWKYKQLVVKAAMAASLAPPTGKHQPSQGWTSKGASFKTVLFWFSTSAFFHEEEKQWHWRGNQMTRFSVVWKLWLS